MSHHTSARIVTPALTCLALGLLAGCGAPDTTQTTPTSNQAGVTASQTSTQAAPTTPAATTNSTNDTKGEQPQETTANKPAKSPAPSNAAQKDPNKTSQAPNPNPAGGTKLSNLKNCEDPKLTTALAPIIDGYKAAPEQNSISSKQAMLCHWMNGTGKLIMVSINRNTKAVTSDDAKKRVAQDPEQTIIVNDPRLKNLVTTASGAAVKSGKAESISVAYPNGNKSDQLLIQSIGASFDVAALANAAAGLTAAT